MAVAVEPVRWEHYAAGTEVEHFAWWCERYLVQSVDRFAGEPLVLEPWQLEFMGEALAVTDAMLPVWQSVVLIVSRKNGKTALLAAYALWRLLNDEGQPEILLAAASDKQAGRLFGAVVSYVRRNPELAAQVHLREYVGEIARVDGGGSILRMANDPDTLHGYNPSLVICDELHAWTKPSQREAWSALVSGGGARTRRQVFTITTAGSAQQRESSILGAMLDANERDGEVEDDAGLTISRNRDGETLVYNYSAPTTDPRDLAAMKLANPASWITEDYLRRQAKNPELTDSERLRLHGCVWAASLDSWLPAGAWRACEAPERRVMPGERIVAGFDGSYNRDSTALVGVTLDPVPHVFVLGVWERPDGAPEAWKVDRGAVKARVDQVMNVYDVALLVCDPNGWHDEVEEWAERYAGTWTLMYPVNRRQLVIEACSRFYSAVLERQVSQDGDRAMARHFANAVVKVTPDGKYITKDHPDSPRKIDLAAGAVMAHDQAVKARDRLDAPLFEVWG